MYLNCYSKIGNETISKSYISVGKDHSYRDSAVLVVSRGDKPGRAFKLRGNIELIESERIHIGSVIINFKHPRVPLCISGVVPAVLEKFLNIIYSISVGKLRNYKEITRLQIEERLKTYKLKAGDDLSRFNQIVRCKSLVKVIMKNNNLTELPIDFGELNLLTLDLSNNKLSNSNFLWLEGLHIRQALKVLIISQNSLTEVPIALVDFYNLEVLNVSNNNIQYLPYRLGYLQNLKELDVSKNLIQSLPRCLTTAYLNKLVMDETAEKPSSLENSVVTHYNPLSLVHLSALVYVNEYGTGLLHYQNVPLCLIKLMRSLPKCRSEEHTVLPLKEKMVYDLMPLSSVRELHIRSKTRYLFPAVTQLAHFFSCSHSIRKGFFVHN